MGSLAGRTGRERRVLRIRGTVQGVGFRPYVYRLARELELAGAVRNEGGGVVVEVEGEASRVRRFAERLAAEAPPLADIEGIEDAALALAGAADGDEFAIEASAEASGAAPRVSPDVATCPACLRELLDPSDRRYRYPYINCTDCGPRFTIVRGVPYDRARTTMAGFEMCVRCRAEYEDPSDRRFHAQPNACPDCGPSVRLVDAAGRRVERTGAAWRPGVPRDPIAGAAAALREGAIVAVKGVGGYHLACRADDEGAVRRLRERKRREAKPFAILACDMAAARRLIVVRAEEERLLGDPARPIVVARRRDDSPVAAGVAPGHRDLGVMLPYSPVHHLLIRDAGAPLVLTSGNRSGEPIEYRDDDAQERLRGIADLFLLGDRPIHIRADDSVVRVVSLGGARRPLMMRRSRGYVPAALELPVAAERPVLACGAELKNTFSLVHGRLAWVAPHIGDLERYETLHSFRDGVAHFEDLFGVAPRVVAHDLHPQYLSTRYALDRIGLEPVGVQHHHAHLAACLAEHGEQGPAIGAIYDGAGYGADGGIWGGELLLGDLADAERIGHLRAVRLPGGASAIREPWRMACAWLTDAYACEPALPARLSAAAAGGDGGVGPRGVGEGSRGAVTPARWRAVAELVRTGLASPWTTSVGRLFDAVAALCGLHARVSYEGQAAIALEMAAVEVEPAAAAAAYPLPSAVAADGSTVVLDARDTIRAVMDDLAAGVEVGIVAARFHEGLAGATADVCAAAAARHRVETVVLSGGVFQNVRLLERTASLLAGRGPRVLAPRRLPPNDGGVAYGQAAVAAARTAANRGRDRRAVDSNFVAR